MKHRLLAVILTALIASPAFAATSEKSTLLVDGVEVGQLDGDVMPSQFSVIINFQNTGDEIKDWQFGFYMPRTFATLATQNINPDLTMQICEANGGCINLRYIKTNDIKANDKSQGYFTLLEPMNAFPLKAKTTYFIRLAHSNQWSAGNLSAMPQSMFITNSNEMVDGIPKIYTLNTEMTNYQLNGYDQYKVDTQVQNYISSNWQNSQINNSRIVDIVPTPNRIISGLDDGFVRPTKSIAIHNQLNTNNIIANYIASTLKQDWALSKKVLVDNDASATTGIIIQDISDPRSINNNPEGYRLTISNENITIETMTATGAYYALQTLRQISAQSPQNLPSLVITDYPHFKYRGILLDTARHYFTVNEIKTLIDVMANQKLNTLHIHFSDDEAFRLALSDYPTIATIGASRGFGQSQGANMLLQNNLDSANLSQPQYPLANTIYSGSYSADDINAIVNYANANQITIIPEIDLPGHARALIKALPQIMVDPNDNSQFMSVQGYTDDVLPVCTYDTNISVGNQFTPTINNIVSSVANMFNNQTTLYAVNSEVSLAGDEVSSHAWTNDTSCRNEWANLSALEKSHFFFQKLAVNNSNLMLSGWQQLVQSDGIELGKNIVPASQTGHVWVWNTSKSGVQQAANLANNNYPTILAYADKSYFDLAYTPEINEPGFTWANDLNDTHNMLSMEDTISSTQAASKNPQNILGVEGALWSENLPSFEHLMYMALPKMPALAEVGWSQPYQVSNNKQLNWQDLASRLGCGTTGYLAYLHKTFGVNYRGYPNGIAKEVPADTLCQTKGDVSQN